METKSKGSLAAADVSALLRARNPLLLIVTREEARAELGIMEALSSAQYAPKFWDCAKGISNFEGQTLQSVSDPVQVLNVIRDSRKREVWVLRDLSPWFRDATVVRALRSLVRDLPQAPRDEARAVVLISPSAELPPELAGHAIVIEWPLPDRAEIAALLDGAIGNLPEAMREQAAPNGARDSAIDAAVGLTAEEANSCFAKSLVSSRKIDPATVAAEKKRVIAREKVLEWLDPLPGGLNAVGGLDLLKGWLRARKAAFGPKARAYGLPAPKGLLLVGVPGNGKSLVAKAIAAAWGMPLLKMDLGALRNKFVGESEGNIRKALKVAEAVAPCVLMLDELEKSLAGATQGAADGGVAADALGAILSWMQERAGAVFVVATANDVSSLPPELLRKGRFDDLFFFDLPDREDRAAILTTALKLHGRTMGLEGLYGVADACAGFTGAELAALVPDALFASFADGERDLEVADLMRSAAATVPLSRSAAEKIEAIRKWGKANARPAASVATATASAVRSLDI